MFKFDRNTVPYHISNLVFYLVTLAAILAVYYFAFLPPLLEVTTADFFATFGLAEFVGSLFFLILILIPLALLAGAAFHLIRLVKNDKNVPVEN